MDASSTAWLLMATGLVFLMLPGVVLPKDLMSTKHNRNIHPIS